MTGLAQTSARPSLNTGRLLRTMLPALSMTLILLAIAGVCGALALTETWIAKMRILRVPRLLAGGSLLCVLGLASWFIEGGG